MKEEFVFLTSVSDAESELACQRLADAGIKYNLRQYTEGFVFTLYGGHSPVGKRIFVLNSDLKIAKELLGIKDEKFSPSKGKVFTTFKIIAFVLVLFWILSIVASFISALSLNKQ